MNNLWGCYLNKKPIEVTPYQHSKTVIVQFRASATPTKNKEDDMKAKELIDVLSRINGQREVVFDLIFDENDLPEGSEGIAIDDIYEVRKIKAAPRRVSSRLKDARQFDGEDKDIALIVIELSDY